MAFGTEVTEAGSGETGPASGGLVDSSPEEDPAQSKRRFLDLSRRGFLRTGSIGVLAAGVVGSVPGLGSILGSAEADAPAVQGGATEVQAGASGAEADAAGAVQSFSARVSNLSTGEMKLFVGNQTLRIQDADLAQRLSAAARAAQAAGR